MYGESKYYVVSIWISGGIPHHENPTRHSIDPFMTTVTYAYYMGESGMDSLIW